MTANDILDLLIARLIRTGGGTKRAWRLAVGPVQVYDPSTHAHCNWSVSPSGSVQQNALIEEVLDDLRLAYPIVARG